MSARRVLVVGAGRRVLETALPALDRARDAFEVRLVTARRAREIETASGRIEVHALAGLDEKALAEVDLAYVAVGKDAVPEVLALLARRIGPGLDLLLDTPVLRVKHFRHLPLLSHFRRVSVAEDTAFLPWFDAVRAATPRLGPMRRLILDRSAWAYHAIATSKTLLDDPRVRRGRRARLAGGGARRILEFAGGSCAEIVEPRDYSIGTVRIEGERAALASRRLNPCDTGAPPPAATEEYPELELAPLVEAGACVGFRAGEHEVRLDADEIDLLAGDPPEAGVIARQEAAKRVGFLRLLRRLAARGEAYPLANALDDTVVDYWLEKLGRYRATPLTAARAPLARRLYRTISLAAQLASRG